MNKINKMIFLAINKPMLTFIGSLYLIAQVFGI